MEQKAVPKPYTIEDTRNRFRRFGETPEKVYKEAGVHLAKLDDLPNEKKDDYWKTPSVNKIFRKAIALSQFETHTLGENTVTDEFSPAVAELASQLIRDYNCTTSGETTLAELVASAYGQYLMLCEVLKNSYATRGKTVELSALLNNYLAQISKEKDRAFKQYRDGLALLNQIKNPIRPIKANNAYIAENQQFNSGEVKTQQVMPSLKSKDFGEKSEKYKKQ